MYYGKNYQYEEMMMTLTKILLTLIVFVCIERSNAQIVEFHQKDTSDINKTYYRYNNWSFKFQYGGHLPTGVESLANIEANPYTVYEFRFGVDGYGRRKWHQLFNFPEYGLGFYQAVFIPNNNSLGNPNAIYLFFNAPFKRWENTSLNYDVSVGLSYNFLGYDPEQNPEQTAIGSNENVHFAFMLEYAFPFSDKFESSVGLGFTHFSNGRSRTPNKGVNLVSLIAKLNYNAKPRIPGNPKNSEIARRPTFIRHQLPTFHSFFEYAFAFSGGVTTSVENIEDRELRYGAASVTFDTYWNYGYIGKAALGLDFFYDGSLVEEYASDYGGSTTLVPTSKTYYFGIHFGHELMVHRWVLITDVGFTFRDVKGRGTWFTRVGFKYQLTRHMFLKGALKTPGGFIADFIEWGVGFNVFSKKKFLKDIDAF